jgi:hypothetical protein
MASVFRKLRWSKPSRIKPCCNFYEMSCVSPVRNLDAPRVAVGHALSCTCKMSLLFLAHIVTWLPHITIRFRFNTFQNSKTWPYFVYQDFEKGQGHWKASTCQCECMLDAYFGGGWLSCDHSRRNWDGEGRQFASDSKGDDRDAWFSMW